MNNKVIGTLFCLIAALLMSARYLTASIYIIQSSTWSYDLFHASLEYVGSPLLIASVLALIAGISFLAFGLYQDFKK